MKKINIIRIRFILILIKKIIYSKDKHALKVLFKKKKSFNVNSKQQKKRGKRGGNTVKTIIRRNSLQISDI